MWVQAWNIPVQWLMFKMIFNQCSNVVILENDNKEGRYVKLLVDVDLTKPLIRGTNISFEGGKR